MSKNEIKITQPKSRLSFRTIVRPKLDSLLSSHWKRQSLNHAERNSPGRKGNREVNALIHCLDIPPAFVVIIAWEKRRLPSSRSSSASRGRTPELSTTSDPLLKELPLAAALKVPPTFLLPTNGDDEGKDDERRRRPRRRRPKYKLSRTRSHRPTPFRLSRFHT